MERKTITEEFIYRMDNELKFHTNLYKKEGEPFGSQELSSMAGGSLPAVDLWHGLWYQGEMACLFGEPNVGKTILAMQIANEVCRRGLKTLYFDFENAAHQFKPRYSTDKYDYMSNDASFIVKPLNPNNSTAPLDSRSILDYIKKDFVTERAPVIIIDDITHLIGSGDQADVRHVLNTLRSWTQHYLVSILVLTHSKRRKWSSLTTIDSLAGSFEYSYAFDSIFSLTRANEYNAQNNVTHYIKHHKNRMGPVLYNDMNVITAQFGRDEGNGFLQFNELYTGGNERQLLRDNGYDTFEKINQAIMHYKSLHFSTREIAGIVGCSQSHVSRTIRRNETQQEKSTASTVSVESNDSTLSPLHSSLSTITWLPSTMPRIKLEPDLTPIYDASKYTIDPYGQRVTIEEYNQYFNEDEEEQENFFNPFGDDDYEEDEFDDDDWDDWDDDNEENTALESTASRESSTFSKSTEPAEPTESAESSESGESSSSNDSVNVLGDAVAVKKPVLNTNSSLKKLMKKSSKK